MRDRSAGPYAPAGPQSHGPCDRTGVVASGPTVGAPPPPSPGRVTRRRVPACPMSEPPVTTVPDVPSAGTATAVVPAVPPPPPPPRRRRRRILPALALALGAAVVGLLVLGGDGAPAPGSVV